MRELQFTKYIAEKNRYPLTERNSEKIVFWKRGLL